MDPKIPGRKNENAKIKKLAKKKFFDQKVEDTVLSLRGHLFHAWLRPGPADDGPGNEQAKGANAGSRKGPWKRIQRRRFIPSIKRSPLRQGCADRKTDKTPEN